MKKIMMIACGLLMASVSVNAQGLTFGAKAGLNYASINVDDASSKIGFHVGGVVNYGLNDSWSLVSGLSYSVKGTKQEYSEDLGGGFVYDYSDDWSFSYLEIPIMAQYKMESGLNFSAGPYVGLLMSAKDKYEYTFPVLDPVTLEITSDTESGSEDVKELCNSTDFGVNVGVGYSLESGLGFGLNYSKGLNGIFELSDEDYTHSVIGLNITYMFGGK